MMRSKYYSPTFKEKQFNCIHCGVFADQAWHKVLINVPQGWEQTKFDSSKCKHCEEWTFWYDGKMIVPTEAPVEPHHPDLPDDCIPEYDEAREIFARSPRASAALLRLCIQKLMPHLGESGKNVNDDIKSLVAKGLPVVVQQALDYCRVVGNHAVHPGEIILNDTPEIAQNLFEMINFIVEDRITRPKEVEKLYSLLPETDRKNIERRDKGNK